MVIPFRFFGFPAMYLDFQSFDFERTWWSLFHKRVVPTNLDIYVYITITGRYLCWWIISHRLYQLPNSRCFATDMDNLLYLLLKCTYHQYAFPHENDVRFFFTPCHRLFVGGLIVYCVFCGCLRIVMSNILSYHISVHSEFRVLMSSTISA